jgi:predicted DNA-binding ribbon-helix-helix protein
MDSTLYDRDYYQWLTETAYLLAEGRLSEMDVPNLLDEIEAMGKSQKRAIASYLRVLLLHLLKWQYQPEKRTGSWRSSIRNARLAIAERIEESPSLQSYPETVLPQCYRTARANAADETGLPLSTFPETPLFTLAEILAEEFLP